MNREKSRARSVSIFVIRTNPSSAAYCNNLFIFLVTKCHFQLYEKTKTISIPFAYGPSEACVSVCSLGKLRQPTVAGLMCSAAESEREQQQNANTKSIACTVTDESSLQSHRQHSPERSGQGKNSRRFQTSGYSMMKWRMCIWIRTHKCVGSRARERKNVLKAAISLVGFFPSFFQLSAFITVSVRV